MFTEREHNVDLIALEVAIRVVINFRVTLEDNQIAKSDMSLTSATRRQECDFTKSNFGLAPPKIYRQLTLLGFNAL